MANEDDLPSEFDLIVLGTGMPESILAAAAARVGQTVLHVDKNEYYGGNWASFNFDQLLDWMRKQKTDVTPTINESDFNDILSTGEQFLPNGFQKTIFNLSANQFVSDKNEPIEDLEDSKSQASGTSLCQEAEEKPSEIPGEEDQSTSVENVLEVAGKISQSIAPSAESKQNKKVWTLEELSVQRRKFNIDLTPKLLFSRGPLVELLISSNIARYAEFKSATRVLTFLGNILVQVPCSRADVFSTKHVSVVEKRMLMKFIAFCLDFQKHPDEYRGYEGKPFKDFVKSRKLTPNVEHYIIHAIAMVDPDTPTLQSLTRVQKFLESLGRYGNSPFLWPIYGSAELPQCFCRLCAVFGGIYYLNRPIEGIIIDSEEKCAGIVTRGKRINCKWLVMEPSFAPLTYLPDNPTNKISKGIFITDRSIMPAEREQLTLLRIQPEEPIKNATTILEVGPGACVCPPGLNIVYASCVSGSETAELDMKPILDKLFQTDNEEFGIESKPNVIWSLYFNQLDLSGPNLSQKCPPNAFIVPTPDTEQDYENSIEQARVIFEKIFPQEEFLPRAPDPEEIILESDEPNSNHCSTEEAAEALEDLKENEEQLKEMKENEEQLKEMKENEEELKEVKANEQLKEVKESDEELEDLEKNDEQLKETMEGENKLEEHKQSDIKDNTLCKLEDSKTKDNEKHESKQEKS